MPHYWYIKKKAWRFYIANYKNFVSLKKSDLGHVAMMMKKKTQLTWEKISDLGDIQHQCHELGGLFYEDSIRIKEGKFLLQF